jgi:RNA polymerase sigma-70 factor (ECF subfamily)
LRFLGCDRAQADDLTQETFLQVLRHGFVERDERATAAFLRTVARNCFLMSVRKTRFVSVEDIDEADAAYDQGGGDDENGEARLRALRNCLEFVHGRAKAALEMQFTQRRTGEDIAQALGISHENVRVLLHRAKQTLKKCIESKLGRP